MKVIDLLNIWVTNRTKLPKKIKVGNKTFLYNEELNLYVTPDKQCYLIQDYLDCIEKLNKKVEVIEENKEIEELHEYKNIGYSECDIKTNREKLNEVIRAVNKINKDLEKGQTLNIEIDEETISNAIKKARNYLEREEK